MIAYVRDMAFEYGRADRVSPRITRVVADNPGPFTFLGTGTYIVGEDEVAVIDPGPLLDAHLAAILRAVEGRRVSAILTTHTHADHSPLAHPLKALTGAPIWGRAAPTAPLGADAYGAEEPDEATFRPDIEIADGERVVGPGWTLEALATPGHAVNHMAYALLEENALFCGDHIMGWSTTVVIPPEGDMGQYYASLDKVAARGFDTLWPTHGPPITEVAPFVESYRDHRLNRERQILGELARGPNTVAGMTPRLYAGVDRRLHPAAQRMIWAHLIHLTRTGRTQTEGEPTLGATYRLARA